MPDYKVHYRSAQTNRKRHKTVQAPSESEARKLVEPEATEIYEITFVPEPLATDRQIRMLRSLGANPQPGLTLSAASGQIEALLKSGRGVDDEIFHEGEPASERQLEYYRALGKKITPDIQQLSYNQMSRLIEKAKEAGAVADYDIVDREKPATESQFSRLRHFGIEVTPEMLRMNKAEIKKIIRTEEEKREKIRKSERDARSKIYLGILKTLPTVNLSAVPYKIWADSARNFKRRFAKFGADCEIDPRFSVDLFIEGTSDTDETDDVEPDEYHLSLNVLFESDGPEKGLASEFSVGVDPYEENGFEFSLLAVPITLPFLEGKYLTEQKYWAEFLRILTSEIEHSSSTPPALGVSSTGRASAKTEGILAPSRDPQVQKKSWWRRFLGI